MFSKVPRLKQDTSEEAIKEIHEYLLKQQDELDYRFLNLDSSNVYEIDCNLTNMKNLPKVEQNVITEVIHQQVINVETAHILNAWIKNLFVQHLETNFDALVPSNPTTERLYVRVINNEFSFIEAKLSPTDVEPLLIADPNGNGGKVNVYYTAIGNHPDAYRYFTITNPKQVHKDLTDAEAEAFRVLVKKTLTENVKMKISFKEVELSNGTRTVTPVMTLGIGSDPTGGTSRGISEIFKDILGVCLKQNLEINDTWCGFRLNSTTGAAEYRNPITGVWIDLSNITVGGTGNNVYWLDKTTFDESMLTKSNCNHYGINTATTDKIVGQYSTLYRPSSITFLGVERQTVAPPVEAIKKYLFGNGHDLLGTYYSWRTLYGGNTGSRQVVTKSESIDIEIVGSGLAGVTAVYFSNTKYTKNDFKKICVRSNASDTYNNPIILLCKNILYSGEIEDASSTDAKHWYKWGNAIELKCLNGYNEFYIANYNMDEFYIGCGNSTDQRPRIGSRVSITEVWLE